MIRRSLAKIVAFPDSPCPRLFAFWRLILSSGFYFKPR